MITKIKNSFHTYAITAIVFWALAFVLTRLCLHHYSAFALGFLRYFIASCVLGLMVVATKTHLPRRADIPYFIAAGACGFAIYITLFNIGCITVPAATSSLIIATVPVVTALMARILFQEKLSRLRWLASLVELSGVALLTIINGVLELNRGVWWLLAGVMFFSVYNLLQHRLSHSYSALQISFYSIFAGTLMLAVFLPAGITETLSAPPIQLFYLAMLGIFSSAIAYLAWAQAFAKAEQTSSVSNYMFLTPFLTAVLGFWLAGENVSHSTLAGGALILLGMAMFNFGDKLMKNRSFFAKKEPKKLSE